MSESTPQTTDASKLLLQRVQLLYAHAPRAVPFNLINGAILTLVLWGIVENEWLLSWFGALVLLTLLRSMAVRHQVASGKLIRNSERAHDHFTLGSFLTGAVWGVGYFMLGAQVPDAYKLLYLLVLGGMASGAFTSMAASTQAYAAYILPMVPPAAIAMLFSGNAVEIAAGIMMGLYTLMMLITHRMSSHQLLDGIRLKHENEDLVHELSSSNEQLKRSNEKLRRVKDDLRVISLTDELTGLSNRRHFSQMLKRVWKVASREKQTVSCLMIDIDHFKAYNDHYGHQDGDECLRQVAQTLQQGAQRPQDLLARYGGEEFIVVLPDTSLAGAVLVAERMLADIHGAAIEHKASPSGRVSFSIGLAACKDVSNSDPDNLIKAADAALYNAKNSGRDRLSISAEALSG